MSALFAAAPALPLRTAGPYVAAAYIVFVALILIYVAIMARKLTRTQRELRALRHELELGERLGEHEPAVRAGELRDPAVRPEELQEPALRESALPDAAVREGALPDAAVREGALPDAAVRESARGADRPQERLA